MILNLVMISLSALTVYETTAILSTSQTTYWRVSRQNSHTIPIQQLITHPLRMYEKLVQKADYTAIQPNSPTRTTFAKYKGCSLEIHLALFCIWMETLIIQLLIFKQLNTSEELLILLVINSGHNQDSICEDYLMSKNMMLGGRYEQDTREAKIFYHLL